MSVKIVICCFLDKHGFKVACFSNIVKHRLNFAVYFLAKKEFPVLKS